MAKFLTGSLMRHVIVMSMSASIGLIAVFLVDFVDLYFISMLGEAAMAAAVGFAGTLLYFALSVAIGLTIAVGALVAPRLGAGRSEDAREVATSALAFGMVVSVATTVPFWVFAPELLSLLGAEGETRDLATSYLRIVLPAMPIGNLGMMCSGILRAHGDARRAMTVTFWAAGVNAVLDPLFIFTLDYGLNGAAMASAAARVVMAVAAVWAVLRHHGGFAPYKSTRMIKDLGAIIGLALPALLTNIATPVGNGIVTRALAPFGDDAVAGYAVASRLIPLAFCLMFALSGAIGPIVGQNFGARRLDRVGEAIWRAVQFNFLYALLIWGLLVLLEPFIVQQFGLTGAGADIVYWFALVVAPLFFFNGALFIANGSFNNLGRPLWSTMLNWGRNTVGLVPLVWLGAEWGLAPGVMIGQAAGGVVFGLLGLWLSRRLVTAYQTGKLAPGHR